MIPQTNMLTFANIRISFGSFRENYGYGVPGALILVTILVTQIALDAWAQAQQRQTLPPGPRGWPISGNILAVGSSAGLSHRILRKLSVKYECLMYLHLGNSPSKQKFLRDRFGFLISGLEHLMNFMEFTAAGSVP